MPYKGIGFSFARIAVLPRAATTTARGAGAAHC